MLKEKYLATNSIYLSYDHREKNIKKYLNKLDKVFKKISDLLKNKKILRKIQTRKFSY